MNANYYQDPQFQQYNQQYNPQQQQYPQQYQPSDNYYQPQQANQQNYQQQQQQQAPYQQQQQPQQYYQQQASQQQQMQQQQYQQDSLTQFQQQQEQHQQLNQQMQQMQQQPVQPNQDQYGKFQRPPSHQHQNEVEKQFQQQYGQYKQDNQPQEIINNVKPRTRTEREAMRDKESIEKSRINQRVGYEARNINMRDLLQNPDAHSTLFIPENQRFDKDFAVYDKQKRQEDLQKKELIQEKHRVQGLERESRRWEQIENQVISEQQKREYQAKVLLAGKRNCNGLPYNPLTLQYDDSDQGRKLKARDDDAKVRAYVRSQNLDSRSNSGYNILTGDQRQGVEQLVPEHMKQSFEHKMKQKEEFYSVKWKPEDNQY